MLVLQSLQIYGYIVCIFLVAEFVQLIKIRITYCYFDRIRLLLHIFVSSCNIFLEHSSHFFYRKYYFILFNVPCLKTVKTVPVKCSTKFKVTCERAASTTKTHTLFLIFTNIQIHYNLFFICNKFSATKINI